MSLATPLRATTSAVEAEATGQAYLVAEYRGHEFKLPGDVEDWPLRLIAYSVGLRDGALVPVHATAARALAVLVGPSAWREFLHDFPQRRHLIPLTTACAEAAGFVTRRDDVAFGALPRLIATLEQYPGPVEATLAEMGLDYRDRWRLDDAGRRRLTLRQIHVRLSYADPACPLGIAQNDGKRPHNGTELLLMDLFEAVARVRHPSRAMPVEALAERAKAQGTVDLEAERAKYRDRHKPKGRRAAAIETARENARPGGGAA